MRTLCQREGHVADALARRKLEGRHKLAAVAGEGRQHKANGKGGDARGPVAFDCVCKGMSVCAKAGSEKTAHSATPPACIAPRPHNTTHAHTLITHTNPLTLIGW